MCTFSYHNEWRRQCVKVYAPPRLISPSCEKLAVRSELCVPGIDSWSHHEFYYSRLGGKREKGRGWKEIKWNMAFLGIKIFYITSTKNKEKDLGELAIHLIERQLGGFSGQINGRMPYQQRSRTQRNFLLPLKVTFDLLLVRGITCH